MLFTGLLSWGNIGSVGKYSNMILWSFPSTEIRPYLAMADAQSLAQSSQRLDVIMMVPLHLGSDTVEGECFVPCEALGGCATRVLARQFLGRALLCPAFTWLYPHVLNVYFIQMCEN